MAPSRGGGGRPDFAAMGVELRPGLVSVGQNSAAPSPEMEAEAVAAVRPQICGVFGNEKKGSIMDDDLSAKSHHCSRIPTTSGQKRRETLSCGRFLGISLATISSSEVTGIFCVILYQESDFFFCLFVANLHFVVLYMRRC